MKSLERENDMGSPVKVLFFVDRLLTGGIQTFVFENWKHMDKSKVQIDFLVLDDGNNYKLEKEIELLGSTVYKLKGVWLKRNLDFLKYCRALDNFFKKHHDYKVVHMHSSSKNFFVLKYAKKYGINIRIAHSHNIGFQSKNKYKIFIGNILKKPLKKYATHYFACSKLAGKWLFDEAEVKIVHNAVDYEKFKFNQVKRNELRKKIGVEDCLVIGHVGRFTNQKNHMFLVDIFNEIHKLRKNAVLMLVGIGEKEQEIRDKVEKLGLTDNVKFMGFCTNTNELFWCMDVFLLPSLYEGLPIVGVEAQCTGLPCFMSKDVITDEVKIAENVKFVELEKTPEEWARTILNSDLERKDTYEELKSAGYFIEQTVEDLERFYREERG